MTKSGLLSVILHKVTDWTLKLVISDVSNKTVAAVVRLQWLEQVRPNSDDDMEGVMNNAVSPCLAALCFVSVFSRTAIACRLRFRNCDRFPKRERVRTRKIETAQPMELKR